MKIDRDEFECSDPENFTKEAAPKEFHEFKGWKERTEKFNESLRQRKNNSKH